MVYRRPYLTSGSAGFALNAISRAMKKELKVCSFFSFSSEAFSFVLFNLSYYSYGKHAMNLASLMSFVQILKANLWGYIYKTS